MGTVSKREHAGGIINCMKQKKKFHPSELVLRCLAMKKNGYWVAMCIDLDLAVQADSLAKARMLLQEQMRSYVADAFGCDSEHAGELLRRRAPIRYFALYYAIKIAHITKRRLSFETAMPMIPAHA